MSIDDHAIKLKWVRLKSAHTSQIAWLNFRLYSNLFSIVHPNVRKLYEERCLHVIETESVTYNLVVKIFAGISAFSTIIGRPGIS